MTTSKRASQIKQAKNLEDAGALFASNGYAGTTLAMIAAASGAAVGSIEHFFGPKPAVTAAVHKDIVVRLAAVIERALADHPADAPAAVPALLTEYVAWATANPHHQRILCFLAEYALSDPRTPANALQERLEPILLAWAQPLIAAGKIRPLTATQLFAFIIAPAMASATGTSEVDTEAVSELASMITAVLTPPQIQPKHGAQEKPTHKSRSRPLPPSNDLFG